MEGTYTIIVYYALYMCAWSLFIYVHARFCFYVYVQLLHTIKLPSPLLLLVHCKVLGVISLMSRLRHAVKNMWGRGVIFEHTQFK